MAEPKKFYLRFSKVEDFDRITAFFAENPHDNVCKRDPALLRQVIDNGSAVLVEDAESGKIVGACISYPILAEKDGIERQKWLEIGSARIILNGYPGLFDTMTSLLVLRSFLVEPPEELFVCQMKSAAVRKMVHKLGFRPFTPSQELVELSDKTAQVEEGETYGFENWYAGGTESLPVMARLMKDVLDKQYLENPKTGERINIDLGQSKFFKIFKGDIVALAGQNCGDPDHPDFTASVAKSRQKWMRHYFK